MVPAIFCSSQLTVFCYFLIIELLISIQVQNKSEGDLKRRDPPLPEVFRFGVMYSSGCTLFPAFRPSSILFPVLFVIALMLNESHLRSTKKIKTLRVSLRDRTEEPAAER